MATYIKGSAVANATSYELFEKMADGNYVSRDEKPELNFDVSALGLGEGDHVLVAVAKADDYETSAYSNEVVYTVGASGSSGSGGGSGGEDTGNSGDSGNTDTSPFINYFNKSDPDVNTTQFRLGNTGAWSDGTATGYGQSGYFPCSAGDKIRAGRIDPSTGVWKANNAVGICFFDANKNYISGLTAATVASGDASDDRTYIAPNNNNIAYASVSVKTTLFDIFMITINEDGVPTEYVAYNAS